VSPHARRYAAWSGLFVGAAAWFAHHQVTSDRVYWACTTGGPLLTGGLGALCFIIAAGSGLVSWRARSGRPDRTEGPESSTFAGVVSAGAAALFCFAILLQGLTGFIVPACVR